MYKPHPVCPIRYFRQSISLITDISIKKVYKRHQRVFSFTIVGTNKNLINEISHFTRLSCINIYISI